MSNQRPIVVGVGVSKGIAALMGHTGEFISAPVAWLGKREPAMSQEEWEDQCAQRFAEASDEAANVMARLGTALRDKREVVIVSRKVLVGDNTLPKDHSDRYDKVAAARDWRDAINLMVELGARVYYL